MIMAERAIIIPIAGGKGGVGKTFVAANLAVALAKRGHSTIAVDLDLGNSNLHSFLGLANRYPGVGEFLRGMVKCTPQQLVVKTSVPNLGFIPGDGRMPFMANISYIQKQALLRLLKALEAEYVLVDLSAGTAFNTLDLFRASDSGIIVTTPEHPALMSTLVFVKALVLRAIDQSLRRDKSLQQMLTEMHRQSVKDPVFTVERFRSALANSHPEATQRVEDICQRTRLRFVYNMVEGVQDTEMFSRIDHTLGDAFSIECDHIGLIPFDPAVRQHLKQPGIFLNQAAKSATATTIDRIARRIISYWHTPIEGSAELLADYALTVFSEKPLNEALASR
jgi:flagellar biosynthesis protein FlhG